MKKKLKKALCFLTALIMVVSFTACKKEKENEGSKNEMSTQENEGRSYITLLYSAADSFNPYTAKTDINRQLCGLLYDGLVKLNNQFEPINALAEKIDIEGKSCVVTLKEAKFSDGSAVTADDVVYSFKLAKAEGSAWMNDLYIASSAKAAGAKTVEFSLTKQDPYFANLLDFPILKVGSDDIKDSDSVILPPIGSGRYVVNKERNGLEQNPIYSGKKGSIKTIKLINAPDNESVSHHVEVGAADMYFSQIADGNIIRMSGKKLDINLNNLVYIGINKNYGALTENTVRQVLSSGIDREKICQNAFYNNALPATGFYSPVWKEVNSVQNIQTKANEKITVENLEKIGYNKLDSDGLRKNSGGSYLNFTLLVNSENRLRVEAARLVSKQLSEKGIKITVAEKSYEAYKSALESGDFQLFIGEIKLTDNMDIYPLVEEGGSLAFGNKTAAKALEETEDSQEEVIINKSAKVLAEFYEGKNTISDAAAVLQAEMPFIPVCYRTGALFCNDNIENIENSSLSDIYFSIEAYKYNN